MMTHPTDPALVPPHIRASLGRYVNDRILPGGFLAAVLRNDLTEAVRRADDNNLRILCAIVAWCYNEIPSTCWGSPEKVKAWVNDAQRERERRNAQMPNDEYTDTAEG